MTVLTKVSLETQKFSNVLPDIQITSAHDFTGVPSLLTNMYLTLSKPDF